MIRQFYMFLALAALLPAGCAKEPVETPDTDPDGPTLTFSYESFRASASRAIAQVHEKIIHDLDIFAFAEDGTFIGKLTPDDYSETDLPDNTTTITATRDFITRHAGKSVVFYFVGNNEASNRNSTTYTTRPKHISSFTGSEADFRELLSNPLGNSPWGGSKAEYIQLTPTNGGGLLMTGREEVELTGKVSRTVELRRRTARFDIVNPAPDNLKITAIYVSNAMPQGPMFGNATGPFTVTPRSIEQIDGPNRADNDHVPYVQEGGKAYRAAGLFYLYPTSTATTEIVIQGYFGNNSAKKYNFPVVGVVDIVANNRYTLQFDEHTTDIIVNLGDYRDGDGNIIIVGPQ